MTVSQCRQAVQQRLDGGVLSRKVGFAVKGGRPARCRQGYDDLAGLARDFGVDIA